VHENLPPNPGYRLAFAVGGLLTTYGPTEIHRQSLDIGKSDLDVIKRDLTVIVETILPNLEEDLKAAGAPWIEGQGLIKD